MTDDATQQRIAAFLSRFFKSHDLGPDDDIFALGFVNSLLAMQLVTFVERDFGITVEDADLDLDNFRSIRAIAALVARKRATANSTANSTTNPAAVTPAPASPNTQTN
jgi:methoxymalonate biosynthesis acyl carrier protein